MASSFRRRWWWIGIGLLLGAVFAGREVRAHVSLVSAEPEAGATLTESPPEIRLTFDGEIEASDSQIALFGEDFRAVTEGVVPLAPAENNMLVVQLPPLEPGAYTVQWVVLSADGHSLRGSYAFALAAPPVISLWMVMVGAVVIMALLGVIALRFLRRSPRPAIAPANPVETG